MVAEKFSIDVFSVFVDILLPPGGQCAPKTILMAIRAMACEESFNLALETGR